MDLTHNLLITNNFEAIYNKIHEEWEYTREVTTKSGDIYFLTIKEGSNTINRDWRVHVDNDYHMTCGYLDFQTTEHFNTFMDLLNIDFKLCS